VTNAIAVHESELHDPFEAEQQITNIAAGESQSAIADHLAVENPHNITPGVIGAVPVAVEETTLILGAEWTPYPSSKWNNIRAIKQGRIVSLQGLVTRDSSNSNSKLIVILPTGFLPAVRQLFISWTYYSSSYYPCRIDVETNGVVSLEHPLLSQPIGWVALYPISFISAA
jgi:hypothetical protein